MSFDSVLRILWFRITFDKINLNNIGGTMNFFEKIKNDSKFLMILLLLLALILMIVFYFIVGFKLWFWISIVLWILFFVRFSSLLIKFSFSVTIIIFFIIFILSVYFMIGIHTPTKNTANTSSNKKLSAEECKPLYDKYNNKVLKISGDNAIGSIGINLTSDCQLSAKYILTFNANLPENPIPELPGSILYNYVTNLHTSAQTERGHYGHGSLSIVRQNTMTLPNAFASSKDVSEYYRLSTQPNNTPANSFYWTNEKIGNFSESRYQEILGNNVFEVVDGLPYMEKEDLGNNGFSYSVDTEKAEKDGKIVKTINLTISE